MALGKCIVPWCKVTGEVVPGRPYACDHHTPYLVTGYRVGMKGAKALVGAAAKRYVKKAPWWAGALMGAFDDGS